MTTDIEAVRAGCAGERVVASVSTEATATEDGTPDRKVTVTRDCGHSYQLGVSLKAPPPEPGGHAMACLGPVELFKHTGYASETVVLGPTFDPRKTRVKRH